MTTANKPENQKNAGCLSDLGQITFTPFSYAGRRLVRIEKVLQQGVQTATLSEDCAGVMSLFISIAATLDGQTIQGLSLTLADLISTRKEDRAWGKKKTKALADEGQAIWAQARAVLEGYTGEPDK